MFLPRYGVCFLVKHILKSQRRFVHAALWKSDDKIEHYSFPEQSVRIKTCGQLYVDWKKQKKFKTVPNGDLDFVVRYIDTSKSNNDENKVNENSTVVLALHGAPGSYTDFKFLTSFLWEQGLRVIAPCFPDFSIYPPGVFRHSAEEKAQFIKDFLAAINVQSIDSLICHSSAIYPSLRLCMENKQPSVSSLILLNPGAHSIKMLATQFFRTMKLCVKMSEDPTGLEVLKQIAGPLLKYLSVVRVESPMDPLLSATAMVNANIPKSGEYLEKLAKQHFPIFFAFSDDDKMIQKGLYHLMSYKLGLCDDDIACVSEDGVLLREGRMVRNVQAISFEKGSHYVFSKYPDIINEAVFSFIQKHVL